MKYFDYSYQVNQPVARVFPYLLDLMSMQEELNYFEKGNLSTNDLPPDQVGKCYYIATCHGDVTVTCTIELIKIDAPRHVHFEYSYQISEKGQPETNGSSFLPWDTMSCITGFEEHNGKTQVTSLMYAHGVDTTLKKCLTWLLGFVNSFKQKKFLKKLANHLNT